MGNSGKGQADVKSNRRQEKSKKTFLSDKFINNLNFILLCALFILIFYPPFVRGLYFEEEQFPAQIFTFFTFMVFWVSKFLKSDYKFIKTPIDYAMFSFVIIYLIPIIAYLLNIGGAVSLRLAVSEWLKYCMYFAIFIMVSDLVKTLQYKKAMLWIISAATIGMCFLGFDSGLGNHATDWFNEIFKNLHINVRFFDTFVEGRIYSTIQYPNAFGAYLIAVFFISICLAIISQKLYSKMIALSFSFIIINTLLYTYSRGAIILFPVIILIFLIALPKSINMLGLGYILSSIITFGFISLSGFYKYMANPIPNSIKLWLLFIVGIFISSVLIIPINILFKNNLMQRINFNWKIVVPLIVLLFVMMLIFLTATSPLVIAHSSNQKDQMISVAKSVSLKTGKNYKLAYEVNAQTTNQKALYVYQIRITTKSLSDLLSNDRLETLILTENDTKKPGLVEKELYFDVPKDSKLITVYFENFYSGTKATFNEAKIVEKTSNKVVSKLKLKYKFIPDYVSSKFENLMLSRSSIERNIFYKDGINIFKDHWFLGAGGGAWAMLNFSYQSFLYWSTQVHNYILQLAIEVGIWGILAFLFLMISLIITFILEKKYDKKSEETEKILQATFFSAILALLLHSCMDFDLSLSAISLLLWELLALFNFKFRNDIDLEALTCNFKGKYSKVITLITKFKNLSVHPGIVVFVIILVIILPISFKSAINYAKKAVAYSGSNLSLAKDTMQKAINADPIMPQYKVDYVKLLLSERITQNDQKPITDLLDTASSEAYYNCDVLGKIGAYYIIIGQIEKGLNTIDRATSLRPLKVEEWQQKVNAYYSVIQYYLNTKKYDKLLPTINRCLDVINEAKLINKNNIIPFVFNASTDEVLEKLIKLKTEMNNNPQTPPDRISFDSRIFSEIYDMDINNDLIPRIRHVLC